MRILGLQTEGSIGSVLEQEMINAVRPKGQGPSENIAKPLF
jgi:hypothetical protein